MKPLILLDAAPFCYGPASTLLAIIDHLDVDDVRVVALASGTSAELLANHPGIDAVVACDTESADDLARVEGLFSECSVFVCNTNPPGALFARARGCRVVYVDTLFWMWHELDPELASVDVYAAQDFHGLEENRLRIGRGIRNFMRVGPLIRPVPRQPNSDRLQLISYGGMESKLTVPGVHNRYAWTMTSVVQRALDAAGASSRRAFCGRGTVLSAVGEAMPRPGSSFGFLPHRRFLAALGTCELLFTSPGLTGLYEAMSAGVPSCALLPQNYSQHLQLQALLARMPAPLVGRGWADVYDDFELPPYLPEPEAIAELNGVIRRFDDDTAAQDRYVQLLVDDIHAARRLPANARPTTSGAPTVAALIRGLLNANATVPAARAVAGA